MNKRVKDAIYDLLKTAATYYDGYTRREFNKEYVFNNNVATIKESINKTPQWIKSNTINTPSENITVKKDGKELLKELQEEIKTCDKCELSNDKEGFEVGEGVLNPALMVILYDAKESESKERKLLEGMIHGIHLYTEKNCYITHLVKCKTQVPFFSNDEILNCKKILDKEIMIVKPMFILLLGREVTRELIKEEGDFNTIAGQDFQYTIGKNQLTCPVFVTYSPSQLLKDNGKKIDTWRHLRAISEKIYNAYKNRQ